MMKFAVVSFYQAYPPESGAASVSYNLAKFLPEEKYLIQLSHNRADKKDNNTEDGAELINIYIYSKNRVKKFFKLLFSFYTIQKVIKKINPDLVIMEGASWAFYYFLLTKFIKFLNPDLKTVYHAHNVEYLLRKGKNIWPIVQITWLSEKWMMNHSDLSTAVSQKDKNSFRKLYGVEPVLLPNGVDTKVFYEVTADEIKKIKKKYKIEGKVILFMGLSGYRPTAEALEFLIYKVFPKILSQDNNIKLAVLGGKIDFKKEFILNPGLIPYREVPVFIKACDVGVAPIFSGSGTRIKILEYMAAGKPVVSTPKGAEGLDIEDGQNIIIADNEDEFARAILYLLKHQEKAKLIGANGKNLVESKYSWEKIVDDFLMKIKK